MLDKPFKITYLQDNIGYIYICDSCYLFMWAGKAQQGTNLSEVSL